MNTTANGFSVSATANGTEHIVNSFPSLERAKGFYFQTFHNLSTDPKLLNLFELKLSVGSVVLFETTPAIRAELHRQANFASRKLRPVLS